MKKQKEYGFFKACKDLYRYAKDEKKQMVIGFSFMLVFVITSMLYKTANSNLIASIMSMKLEIAAKLIVICAIIRMFSITFCNNQYSKVVAITGEKIAATIQKNIYKKMLSLSMNTLDHMDSGKILTTIRASDSNMIKTIISLFQEAAYIATSIVMLLIIYGIDYKIGLGVTIISIISLFLFKFIF